MKHSVSLGLCLFVFTFITLSAVEKAPDKPIPADEQKLHDGLKKDNPDYNGKAIFKRDQSGKISIAMLQTDPNIKNISALKGLQLTQINLMRTKVEDLSPLAGMPLTQIIFYNAKLIKDLSPLKNAKLTQINLERTAVADLSPLKGQPIRGARIYARNITDITPLAEMPLKHLDVGNAPGLKDISVTKTMPDMHDLRVDNTSVADISPVKDLKKLKLLSIFNTKIQDLTPIKDLQLETLLFSPGKYPKEQLQFIREMKSLKILADNWTDWHKKQTPEVFWKRFDAGEIK